MKRSQSMNKTQPKVSDFFKKAATTTTTTANKPSTIFTQFTQTTTIKPTTVSNNNNHHHHQQQQQQQNTAPAVNSNTVNNKNNTRKFFQKGFEMAANRTQMSVQERTNALLKQKQEDYQRALSQVDNSQFKLNYSNSNSTKITPKDKQRQHDDDDDDEDQDFDSDDVKAIRQQPWSLTNNDSTNQRPSPYKKQKPNITYEQSSASSKTTIEITDDTQKIRQSSAIKAVPIVLSAEQESVSNMIVNEKKNVFFTGPAGTGKSQLLRETITRLKRHYARTPQSLAVCASTGIAALNIGGSTLHSWIGLGIDLNDKQRMLTKLKSNRAAKKRWLQTDTLIVDEISMIDGVLFDNIEWLGRQIRNNDRPFGGIQIVLCGDFFQLPPVPSKVVEKTAVKMPSVLCFDAKCWKKTLNNVIQLTHVFRQRDPVFVKILNEVRMNTLGDESVQVLKGLSRPLIYDDGVVPTELYPLRHQVEASNKQRLRELPGETFTFKAKDWNSRPDDLYLAKKLANAFMAPDELTLKVGAQVMLIVNVDPLSGLVNGSLGRVESFSDKKIPTVRFIPQYDGGMDRILEVDIHEFSMEEHGKMIASRHQFPLMLAWAMSIHKSQGQTIPRLKVDLGKSFEKGQAYVALSRATSLQGLQVLNFDKRVVMAHPRVLEFHGELEDHQNDLYK